VSRTDTVSKLIADEIADLPVQVKPSPVYPVLQVQSKLPGSLVHTAKSLHPPLFSLHSSTSAHRITGLQHLTIGKYNTPHSCHRHNVLSFGSLKLLGTGPSILERWARDNYRGGQEMLPSGAKTGAKERSITIQSYFDKLVLYSTACSNSHACMLVSLNTGENQKYYKIRR